jgi:hypothetical protein
MEADFNKMKHNLPLTSLLCQMAVKLYISLNLSPHACGSSFSQNTQRALSLFILLEITLTELFLTLNLRLLTSCGKN